MARLLARWAAWVIRHRRLVLAAVALITVGLGWASTRVRLEVDADRRLPQDHPYIEALNEVHRLFGDKNLVVVGLFPRDGQVFTPAFLAKVADVTQRIRKLPGANPALVQSLAAPHVKDVRGTADGIVVEPVMDEPPADQAGADAVRARAFANPAYVGTLVSTDASVASVQASFELTPALPDYGRLHAAVVQAIASVDDGTFEYRLSGPVVFLSQLSAYSGRMALFFPLALLVIGLVHYEAFRTMQGLFLPLLTALLSVVWALGFMGLTGMPLDPLNTTTPILILAVAAGHAVQVLKRFYEEYERLGDVDDAIVACLASIGPVMLAAGTVAALSFCSLLGSTLAIVRTFGLFTAFGIVSALAVEMTLIPALRSALPAPRLRERTREAAAHPLLDWGLAAVARAALARTGWVLAGGVALLVVCALLASRVEVNTSLKREFRPTDPVRVDDASLNDRLAGTNTLILLVEGPGEGSLEEPAILRALAGLEERLEAEPGVGKALSYVDHVRTLHRALNADRPDAGDLPGSRKLTAEYLFLYSIAGGSEDFDAILDPSHRVAKVRLLVHDDSTQYGERLIALAKSIVADTFPKEYRVRYTGTIASTAAVTEVMVSAKLLNIAQVAAITLLVAALLLRSFVGGLLVAVPLAVTVAVNFGVMGLLGIPLDTTTATLSALAIGIGADYAMYLLFRLREELAKTGSLDDALPRALETAGKAVVFVSSAIALGYATLCFSSFGVHVHLGGLVALAMVVSSTSALVLLPALVVWLRPSFLDGAMVTRPRPTHVDDVERAAPAPA